MDDVRLARAAAEHHGIVTRKGARALGMTDRQVDRRIASGLLVPLHAGVYRHAATPPTDLSRLAAAVLACDAIGFVSHRSAARLHAFRDVPRWRPEVTVMDRRLPLLAGVDVHRTDCVHAADLVGVEGVPTSSPARCLFELGAVLPRQTVRTAAQDALIRRLVAPADLVDVLDRLGGHGRRGTATMREVVRTLPPADLESELERRLLRLIRLAIPEPPVLQHPIRLPDGSTARLDFAWPDRCLSAEADGRLWHSTSADFERDLRRVRGIQAAGWRHVRYGWADVTRRQDDVVAELRSFFVGSATTTVGDPTKDGEGQTVWRPPAPSSDARSSHRRRRTEGLSSSLLT